MRYELRQCQNDNHELHRVEEDGTEVLLGSDRGEPEDNDFRRDWAWVPDELNRLAGEIADTQREARLWHAAAEAFQAERDCYKEALQKSIAQLDEKIRELQEETDAATD